MARHGAVVEHRELTIIHHGGKASSEGRAAFALVLCERNTFL